MSQSHWAIFINNTSQKSNLIDSLLNGSRIKGFEALENLNGALFSKSAIARFIDEEDRHGTKVITEGVQQNLKSMSSGEQKKALLRTILAHEPDFIILDNPYDNLDVDAQEEMKVKLITISKSTPIVQFLSRKKDVLPFTNIFFKLEEHRLSFINNAPSDLVPNKIGVFEGTVPSPLVSFDVENPILIDLRKVNVNYADKPILKNIEWTIRKGEFWELRGKNGSGKTTILSMITGENPKGYGQELYIFGQRKGSGESVWEIKKRIGYFTPSMTDKFTGYHSVANMVISGLNDSIGLYLKPTESQLRLAKEWLQLMELWQKKDTLFHDLSMGQKRLVMCVRAMIKHPPLLILDEPTAGLDDASAELFVALVNKFARESDTAIVFVSHRKEPGLEPDLIYHLTMTKEGSVGRVGHP